MECMKETASTSLLQHFLPLANAGLQSSAKFKVGGRPSSLLDGSFNMKYSQHRKLREEADIHTPLSLPTPPRLHTLTSHEAKRAGDRWSQQGDRGLGFGKTLFHVRGAPDCPLLSRQSSATTLSRHDEDDRMDDESDDAEQLDSDDGGDCGPGDDGPGEEVVVVPQDDGEYECEMASPQNQPAPSPESWDCRSLPPIRILGEHTPGGCQRDSTDKQDTHSLPNVQLARGPASIDSTTSNRTMCVPRPPPAAVDMVRQDLSKHGRMYHVTCKSWHVLDAVTGQVLSNYDETRLISPASLTKMMTAFLILETTQCDFKKLRERVRVSLRAAAVQGTTAEVRNSELYKVVDLLYGMMLPSGNDAAMALAEHYGKRMSPVTGIHPHKRFVHRMNQKARELGMINTNFTNPHGLYNTKHMSTAADMAILLQAAMEIKLYRKIVGTRRHRCTTQKSRKKAGKKGKCRKQQWVNTNQLLWDQQGVDCWEGGKTGWLGNVHGQKVHGCLAATVRRGQRQLCAVLLGSEGRSQRFADMKRLVARTLD